jgi:hypothetical protein
MELISLVVIPFMLLGSVIGLNRWTMVFLPVTMFILSFIGYELMY